VAVGAESANDITAIQTPPGVSRNVGVAVPAGEAEPKLITQQTDTRKNESGKQESRN
jgi:hypothetical protein